MAKLGLEAKSNPRVVPISVGADLTKTKPDEEPTADSTEFASVLGGLLYISTLTRPDLSTACSMLARHMREPAQRHMALLKGVARYLAGTRDMGIIYRSGGSDDLECYTDADYATDKDTRKSRSGFSMCYSGGAVCWGSKLQSVVATSSAESEYIAAAGAARELVWLRRVCADLDIKMTGMVKLQCDNKAALQLAESADSTRTKHIDVCHHYLRMVVAREVLRMMYVNTQQNVADLFTKALSLERFVQHRHKLGVQ